MTLAYIIIACLVGGAISAGLATLLAWKARPKLIPLFVSYAVGALLGVVFLELLPHIFETTKDAHRAALWILVGILAFFMLEKMVMWRHNHDHAGETEAALAKPAGAHAHDGAHDHTHAGDHAHHGRESSAWMVIIGHSFHSFTDGFAIAAAFSADFKLGVVTTVAIAAHELPQELGDVLVLIHSGFSRGRALRWNLISTLATVAGAVIAYFAIQSLAPYTIIFLCFAAASMIYVAIADLIPGLHKRASRADTIQQICLIGLGVGSILLVQALLPH